MVSIIAIANSAGLVARAKIPGGSGSLAAIDCNRSSHGGDVAGNFCNRRDSMDLVK